MLRPGETLKHGAYRIERELVTGGFGVVYLVEDVAHLRKVAIETILPEAASREPQLAEVFYAEVRVTVALHPSDLLRRRRIVRSPVSPVDCMEYVDGGIWRRFWEIDQRAPRRRN